MLGIGRVVVKTRGKEAGRVAVIVDVLEGNNVMIDGNVKRKKCNISHLEPMAQTLDIKKGASTDEVKKLLEEKKLIATPKKVKTIQKRERKKGPKPKRVRKKKAAPAEKGKKKAKKPKMTEDEQVEAALAKV